MELVPQKAALADWKKSHKVWMMMMIAASLMLAGAAEKLIAGRKAKALHTDGPMNGCTN